MPAYRSGHGPHRLPHPLLGSQSPFLVPFATWSLGVPAALDPDHAVVLTSQGTTTGQETAADVGVLAWLQAAWTLMTTPALATTTPAAPPPRRPPGGAATATAPRGPSDVVVVDLRPARRALMDAPQTDPPATGRRLTTRHVVRGHWRHVPHGPRATQRRLQWVDDYVRGPADAPLATRTHVWAWRH